MTVKTVRKMEDGWPITDVIVDDKYVGEVFPLATQTEGMRWAAVLVGDGGASLDEEYFVKKADAVRWVAERDQEASK